MEVCTWPDVPLWTDIVDSSSAATFYHTPQWHEAVRDAYPEYKIATAQFVFEGGTAAVFPCLQTDSGLIKIKSRIHSSAFSCYGGYCASRPLEPDEESRLYSYLAGLKASVRICGNPFATCRLHGCFSVQDSVTQAIRLPADKDGLYRLLNRGARSNLNQAEKKGVTVRADNSETAVEHYCTLYRDTIRRWGDRTIFTYSDAFLHRLLACRDAVLWTAEAESRMAAGAIVLYSGSIAAYFHGASHEDYFTFYPNNMLHMEIMRDAVERGCRWYDFGPSGGRQGVIRFKKSFGAETLPYDTGKMNKK